MSDNDDPNMANYSVGYCRPPTQTQFRKGQSGNPQGRPKSSARTDSDKSANALFLREAERVLMIREGETLQNISAIEAVIRAQFIQATKHGNAYAQKHILERYERAERERRAQQQEVISFWRNKTALERATIGQAKKHRQPAPEFLPHPDDVIIDDETGVRIIGPFDQNSLASMNRTIAFREALIMQAGLDEKLWERSDDGNPLERPGTAAVYAMVLNRSLPPRLRMSDHSICFHIDRYSRHSKRWLLKEVYGGWRKLGCNVPRGQLFPKLGVGQRMIGFLGDYLNATNSGELDTTPVDDICGFIQASGLISQPSNTFER